MQLRIAVADKKFFLTGNGSDAELATGPVEHVIRARVICDLIKSYLLQDNEAATFFAAQRPAPFASSTMKAKSNLKCM
jgi:hypothetical protein